MRVGDREILIPTSMVGNYPNPRWWDAGPVRDWTGDQEPPDSFRQEAFQDAMAALVADQERAGLDIITDGRLHGDNYADQAVYYYYRRLGYDLKGGYLGFPIYSRLHAATVDQEIKRHGAIMVEQARALKRATDKPTKIQYTGVQVLAQATNDLHYDDGRGTARWPSPRRSTRTSSRSTRWASTSSSSTSSPGPTSTRTGRSRRSTAPCRACRTRRSSCTSAGATGVARRPTCPTTPPQAGEIFDLTQRKRRGAVGDGVGRAEVLRGQHQRAQPGELRAALGRPVRAGRDEEPPAAGQRDRSGRA